MNEFIKLSRNICLYFSTSETLAAYVVMYKSLNINKELALKCMKELVKRREFGENFDYEAYIEKHLKEIPKMKGTNIAAIGKSVMNFRQGK